MPLRKLKKKKSKMVMTQHKLSPAALTVVPPEKKALKAITNDYFETEKRTVVR